MNIGLDLGAQSFRSVRRRSGQLHAFQSRSAYSVLPDSPAQRRILEQSGIPYALCEGYLVLIGVAALEHCRLFQVPCISLLPGGEVPSDDPLARQILATLVQHHVPRSQEEGEICCYIPPAASTTEGNTDAEFFTRLIRLQGFRPLRLAAGMALVLAELVDDSFTGIGCSFGAASCDFTLSYQGIEIVSCSIPRGGDWIDEHFARQTQSYCWDPYGNRLLDLEKVAALKEAFDGSIVHPVGPEEKLLSRIYAELLTGVIQEAALHFAGCKQIAHPRGPIQVVCSGGTAQIPGFHDLVSLVFREVSFPVAIREIRLSDPSPYVVARGCLINADLESQSLCRRPRVA